MTALTWGARHQVLLQSTLTPCWHSSWFQFGKNIPLHGIIIETPRNSPEKYDYDEKTKTFILKRQLPAGMCFPYDFGFILIRKAKTGDPPEALVISEFGTFPGCCVEFLLFVSRLCLADVE